MSIDEATERDIISRDAHQLAADDVGLLDDANAFSGGLWSHRELTDIYLLCFAARHSFRSVAFDGNVRLDTLIGANDGHLVVV